jgi:hypothetical protein
MIPSDGRFAVSNDRLTHAAVAAADNVTGHGNMAIYGFNKNDISTLLPLARFWNNPPALSRTRGCTSKGYDKAQRAYQLTAKSKEISFTFEASEESPIFNPCFVIKNWGSAAKANLKINGRKIESGKSFRQGIIRDTDGTLTLVIWFKAESTKSMRLALNSN